jgi:protein O-GlcNAc transferase
MQAFTKHLVPRLGIRQDSSLPERVRVTLLSRSTKHRRIVNENELVNALKTVGYFDVSVVDYKFREFPFLEQIKVCAGIGMTCIAEKQHQHQTHNSPSV